MKLLFDQNLSPRLPRLLADIAGNSKSGLKQRPLVEFVNLLLDTVKHLEAA